MGDTPSRQDCEVEKCICEHAMVALTPRLQDAWKDMDHGQLAFIIYAPSISIMSQKDVSIKVSHLKKVANPRDLQVQSVTFQTSHPGSCLARSVLCRASLAEGARKRHAPRFKLLHLDWEKNVKYTKWHTLGASEFASLFFVKKSLGVHDIVPRRHRLWHPDVHVPEIFRKVRAVKEGESWKMLY